jgi:tRNA-2-methylthio-N6-dimethylallyladenosine synthase
MTDTFVAPEVAHARMQRLVEVVERSGQRKHEARVGRREQVLVEGPSKKDPAFWSGRTRQNKLAHFSPLDGSRAGDTIEVRVTGAAPHWLRGDAVARLRAAPRRRVLLPVEVV